MLLIRRTSAKRRTGRGRRRHSLTRSGCPAVGKPRGSAIPRAACDITTKGPAWYKKSVRIPAEWNGKTLWLKIGGAARYTKAYVNGKLVGSHDGFLTPFKFNISDAVRLGSENVIAVRVDNSGGGPVGCFNHIGNWGGIYRPVEIEATNSTWMEDIFVIPDVDHNQARLRITLGARGKPSASRVKLKVRIFPLATETNEEFRGEKDLDVTQLPQELETELVAAFPTSSCGLPRRRTSMLQKSFCWKTVASWIRGGSGSGCERLTARRRPEGQRSAVLSCAVMAT